MLHNVIMNISEEYGNQYDRNIIDTTRSFDSAALRSG